VQRSGDLARTDAPPHTTTPTRPTEIMRNLGLLPKLILLELGKLALGKFDAGVGRVDKHVPVSRADGAVAF
jgi:hypothetical protein